MNSQLSTAFMILVLLLVQGCTSMNTFPGIARAGDTVSLMVGGSEKANKNTISVTLTDSLGIQWDLKNLGLVRSVFNLRPDARSDGMHYSDYLDTYLPWSFGHEPVQTVLVTDIPSGTNPGSAFLTISLNAADNSSGVNDPFTVDLEIIDGPGSSEQFFRNAIGGNTGLDFSKLEPAPHINIDFREGSQIIGAATLVVDFDETVVNPDDINIYVPESTVRGSSSAPGAFGKTQRMVYWRTDGLKLYIDIIAPQGIDPRFLRVFAMHPRTITGLPNFTLLSSSIYDVNGNTISFVPTLSYYP